MRCILLVVFLLLPAQAFASEASWYSSEACKFNPHKGCPTASGKSLYELERSKQDFAAAWNYPMGAKLKVTNIRNGKSVVVTVLDRGPAKRLNRAIDLSKGAFSKISSLKNGVAEVSIVRV